MHRKACQYDKLYLVLIEQWHHERLVIQLCLGYYSRCHTQILSSNQRIGVGFVADNQLTIDVVASFEVTYQILTVCAAARHEYSDIYFHLITFVAAKIV